MKRITFFLFLSILCYTNTTYSQSFNYIWHFNHEFEGYSTVAADIITTPYNEVYALYIHSDAMDVDPTQAVIPTGGTLDYYTIVKYNDQREYLWHQTLPAGASNFDVKMKQDHNGNIYVYGSYISAFDADPGPGVNTLTPQGFQGSGLLIKLDSNAQYINAVDFDAQTLARVEELDIDDTGNLYLAGIYGGNFDADPGVGVQTHVDGQFGASFVVKLDANFQYIWSFDINSGGGDYATDILVKGNEFYFSGESSQLTDIDPGSGTYMTSKACYVIKFDTASNFIAAAEFGSGDAPQMATGYNDVLLLSGIFRGTTFDADPGAGSYIIPSTAWWDKPYVISLDTNFNFNWAFGLETTNSAPNLEVAGIEINQYGQIITAGRFKGGIELNPGAGTNLITSLNNTADLYLAWYDINGNMVSGHGVLNTNGKYLGSLDIGPDHEVFLPLHYRGTIDVDPDSPVRSVSTTATTSALVIEYSTCPPNVTILTPTICDGDIYAVGDSSLSKEGNYEYRFKTASGCDSIVKVFLTVIKPPYKMNQADDTLVAEYRPNATYQWYNCTTQMLVGGATDSIFIPMNNDAYAFIASESGCIDTSSCVQYLQGSSSGKPKLEWAEVIEQVRWGEHNNMETDKYGNLYVCGTFCGRTDVSLRSDSIFYQEAGNSCDVIVLKFNNDGEFMWGYPIGSAGNSNVNEIATSLAIDDDGNVYIAGNMVDELDFDPRPDDEYLLPDPSPSCCSTSGFIAKLNQLGQIQWAKNFGTGGGTVDVKSMALSPTGRIAVTGETTINADMDPGPSTLTLPNGGYFAIFNNIGILENAYAIPDGMFVWNDSYGHSVSFNSKDHLVVSGFSGASIDMDFGAGTTMLNIGGSGGIDRLCYLAEYDENMNLVWARRIGETTSSIYPRTVLEHDCMDNLYFAGQGISNVNYMGNSGGWPGLGNPFVGRYDANGNFEYNYPINSSSHNSADDVAMDIDMYGNVYVTGRADAGDWFGGTTFLGGQNEQEFVVKYKKNGDIAWLFGIEDSGIQPKPGIAADHLGNLFLMSKGTTAPFDVDPDTGTYNLTTFWNYVAKYGQSCGELDTNITLGVTTIDVPGDGYYVWKRCNDNVPVDTTLNESFTPIVPGDYYAVIYAGDCIDSTGCISIISVGLEDDKMGDVYVYPNPTKDVVNINFGGTYRYADITIMDINGRKLFANRIQGKNQYQVRLPNESGMYFIQVLTDKYTKIKKVIKE